MRSRSWYWLRTRIEGLITRPVTADATGEPAFPNRISRVLWTATSSTRRAANQ